MTKLVPVFMVVLLLQVAAISGLLILRPTHWASPPPEAPALDAFAPFVLEREQSADAYPVQTERPLFVPGRRPVAQAVIPAASVTADTDFLKDVQLLGVYGTSGEEGGVILRYEGELKRVAVGKRLELLTLARIDGMNAVFWDGKKEHVLRLAPIPRAAPVQRPQPRLLPGAAPRAPHEQIQTEAQQPTGADETVQADLPAPEGAAQLPVPAIRR